MLLCRGPVPSMWRPGLSEQVGDPGQDRHDRINTQIRVGRQRITEDLRHLRRPQAAATLTRPSAANNMYVLYILFVEGTVEALDEAIFNFRAATQRPAYRERILAGFDGGIASLRLLRSVERLTDEHDGPSIRQIADDLGIEHSTASRAVDSLVRSGLLSRQRCTDDQRQVRLQLTARGRTVLEEATAHRRTVLASLVRDWHEEDLRTLTRLLDTLRRA